MKLEAVILYSTNDHRFFERCIKNLLACGISCHVVTYTNMWNGDPEDTDILESSIRTFSENPLVHFYSVQWEAGKSPWYWEGVGRFLGTSKVSDSSDYVLYIDVDEIIDVDKFREFAGSKELFSYDAVGLYGYWYWRVPTNQATTTEYTATVVKTSIAKSFPMRDGGRKFYFDSVKNKKIVGEEVPLVHHYSWVRTKEEMIKKVSNWGHREDRDNWLQCIEEEFSNPIGSSDFVHGYSYRQVENKFNIEI